KKEHHRIVNTLFFLWLLLYFGRPTWGILLKLLPLSSDLHLHRFIGGVHLAAIPLIGIGIQTVCNKLITLSNQIIYYRKRAAFITAFLIAAVLIPVYRERIAYLNADKMLLERNREAFKQEEHNISDLIDSLRSLQKESPARIYAGLPAGWGGKFTIGDVP